MIKLKDVLAFVDNFYNQCTSLVKEAEVSREWTKDKKVYGPYTKDNGRKVVVVQYNDGTRETISYPKFIMEEYLQQKLDPNEHTIDHLDYDIENNDINNLRILPRHEHSAEDTRRVKLVKLNCSWCGKEFERSPRIIRDKAKKKVSGNFCSRSCSGKYTRRLQLKLLKKFPKVKPVSSEYYRRKLIDKYKD